jgi:hypothetical protein
MKTPEEIVEHIDHWIAHAMDRPEMYASTPRALEEMVLLLEDLRSFIREDSPFGPWGCSSSYKSYLVAQGFGAASFSSRRADCNFKKLVHFLRQYLISEDRPVNLPDGWRRDDQP